MISRTIPSQDGLLDTAESIIPAGYTYLGQFIGHDLSFDSVSNLDRASDPNTLVDSRTPRFDLDNVYGRGFADQPYLYDKDDIHLLLGDKLDNGKDWDVSRVSSSERAIVGDPRNDENVIISQLHSVFLRFHNRLVDITKADLVTVQRLVRWHYQWVVLYDYLPRIIDAETYNDVLPHVSKNSDISSYPPNLRFFNQHDPLYIPVEFSAAAYRFGHSMVRPTYTLNTDKSGLVGGPFEILGANPKTDLRGFRRFNRSWAVDWALFFEGLASDTAPQSRVQRAQKIGPSVAAPLALLPFSDSKDVPSLPQRNLIRGLRLGLPSGQAVAKAVGKDPISDDELVVSAPHREGKMMRLTEISSNFRDNAPLWYYVLAEAQHQSSGNQLGQVGGRIVIETFVDLMMKDPKSFLREDPSWKPDKSNNFGVPELIKIATTYS
jgi:hypothetical protein